ncbi:hypothetical protein [Cupriavidus sp.]|uniref:hypothetical protein n=1 Tax=Cupriavidus sp. TaxID=1873897 RepID=UPI0028BDAF6C|nr:hypothetical protein [Cupriavidus sp.]
MKIKFKTPDPRAGTVVQLDSSRAQHFIDTGAAVLVKDDDHRSAAARAELDKALASLPGENTDPDYVVGAMRAHFKDLFTEADEAKVRDLVKEPASTGTQEGPQGERAATASEAPAPAPTAAQAPEEKKAAPAPAKQKAPDPKNKGA